MIAAPYGYTLPWAELILGGLLLLGLFGRTTASLLAIISLSIAVALLNAGQLLPNHHIMVFVPLTLWLAVARPGRYSVDAWWSSTTTRTVQASEAVQT